MTPIEHLRAHEREMMLHPIGSGQFRYEWHDFLNCFGVDP